MLLPKLLQCKVRDMSRFAKIHDALRGQGWSVSKVELLSDCWWAKEIWELRSHWTPEGAVIFLTLLIDPMAEIDDNNPPDSAVWAVGLSTDLPNGRLDAERRLIKIGRRMSKAINEIIEGSNQIRLSA